ncbi:MAG: hypothetical protein ABIJ97_05680 [Bacteroidota bacterium]
MGKKFEYDIRAINESDILITQLNILGQERWELIQADRRIDEITGKTIIEIIIKREI